MGLCFDVYLAYDVSILVRRGLAGDEKQFSAFGENPLGVAGAWIR
jgi:hypothetical protein